MSLNDRERTLSREIFRYNHAALGWKASALSALLWNAKPAHMQGYHFYFVASVADLWG